LEIGDTADLEVCGTGFSPRENAPESGLTQDQSLAGEKRSGHSASIS
jgi:hypothetical protein